MKKYAILIFLAFLEGCDHLDAIEPSGVCCLDFKQNADSVPRRNAAAWRGKVRSAAL